MRLLLGVLVLVTTSVVLPAASDDQTNALPGDTWKQLSLDGEKLVDAEVKRALYGVRDMKEVMRSNKLKHQHLMKSLRRSSEKKEGAAQLKQEVTEKLQTAEEQCRDSLQSEWEQCRPCLEEACKTFYTVTCRRGFASFRAKAERFFQRVSQRSGPQEPTVAEAGDIMVNQDPGSDQRADVDEVARIESSFGQLMRRASGLVERTGGLVGRAGGRLDEALRGAFFFSGEAERAGEAEVEGAATPAPGSLDPARDSGFLQGVGLEEVLDSFFDFGRSVVEEFGAVVAARASPEDPRGAPEDEWKRAGGLFPRYLHSRPLCRDLRRQTSACWQLQNQCESCRGPLLKECPSVRELHVALEEASQLLEVCREQYEEILSVVQAHTDQTLGWLGAMVAEFGWVAPETAAVGDSTDGPQPWSAFHITTLFPEGSGGGENATATETEVQVSILNSPPLILSVPGELRIQDPGFLQYVTQEALGKYKDMVRFEDE